LPDVNLYAANLRERTLSEDEAGKIFGAGAFFISCKIILAPGARICFHACAAGGVFGLPCTLTKFG